MYIDVMSNINEQKLYTITGKNGLTDTRFNAAFIQLCFCHTYA